MLNSTIVKLNPLFIERIGTLCEALTENNISYEAAFVKGTNGFMIVFPNFSERTGDIILHDFSYGHQYGGFEGYQNMSFNVDDVCVFDTVAEVVSYAIKQGYKKTE